MNTPQVETRFDTPGADFRFKWGRVKSRFELRSGEVRLLSIE